MDTINRVFQSRGFKRILIFLFISLILYVLKDMINLILFTFIFSFLMNRLVNFLLERIPVNRIIIVIVLYTVIVGFVSLAFINYLPMIANEIGSLVKQLTTFYSSVPNYGVFNQFFANIDTDKLSSYMEQGVTFLIKYFSDVSRVGIQILLALLLSLFYMLEKPRLINFTQKFKKSKIAPIYNEIEFFAGKFAGTFGKVIEAQLIIAVVNGGLTTAALWILGFPQLGGLSIMVLMLGLIPVAGVILSLIPLCIIAYSIGGVMKVVYIVIAITIVHAIEAYILSPKLMSSKTNLPVFYTFFILIFSEHFFGIWGLIVGIPIFVFFLEVFEVNNEKTIKKSTK
ncbi:AI-2E family transporter [Falsibacillus albus]|uniref:AI-2E family transporter n=1 Tax=Falsibacillus albus TaxID=2478915 RepID=A0A3L7JT68_9BACI|nr:AI-2E family transporter [Falsibacillus albus]RLQ93239.1 AI-2E family transporter [Falsibacillus albus]